MPFGSSDAACRVPTYTQADVRRTHIGDQIMATEKSDLLTAGNIAKTLGVTDAKVKKAILQLGIKPVAKKGVCSYYSGDTVAKVKSALK